MRIRRLDLLKFGPFTDQSLSFSNGNFGLHLVYGPNEAGKTSTLRALHQLLFGIPGEKKCQDSFLHQYDKLRIGAELEDVAGNILRFIRRKGGKATALRGADDRSKVAPEKLEQLLGRIDAARFSSQFGIDYDQLREGGAGILEGGGDVGTSLFAAGAGQANFAAILKSLGAECEKLFKERGRNQDINSGLTRLAEAQKSVRQAQLSEAKWSEQRKFLEAEMTQRDTLQEALLSMQADYSRLESFQKALPLIGELRGLQEQIQPLAEVPQLRDDFSEIRRDAVAKTEAGQRIVEQATKRIAVLTGEVNGLKVSENLLANAAAIEELSTDLGRYRELLAALPTLKTRREQRLGNIRRITKDLGIVEGSDRAADHSITIPVRQGIRDLGGQESGITQSVQAATKQSRAAQKRLEDAIKALAESAAGSDTGDLDAAIERIQKYGDLEQQRDAAIAAVERMQQQLEIDLQQKLHWPGTVDEIERLPVPSATVVSRFEKHFDAVVGKSEKLQEEVSKLEQDLNSTMSALKRISLSQDVPTEEDLQTARERRDDAWRLARKTLDSNCDDAAVSDFLNAQDFGGSIADYYERMVAHADEIADRLRREAEKVAEKSQLIARQHELQKTVELTRGKIESVTTEEEELSESWHETWEPASIVPRDPREMAEWLRDHSQILKDAAALREGRLQNESLDKKIDRCRKELVELLKSLTNDDPTGISLEQLLDLSRQVSKDIAGQVRERSRLKDKVTRLGEEKETAERVLVEAKEAQAKWREGWLSATAPLHSDREITPSQAGKLLDAFDELADEYRQIEKLDADVSNSERAIAEFEEAAAKLKANADFTANDEAGLSIVSELKDALSATRTNESLRSHKQEQLEEVQQDLSDATEQLLLAEVTLRELCREAGCMSVDELSEIEKQSERRQRLEKQLAGLRSQLQQLAGSASVDGFVEQATAEDSATLNPRLEQLEEGIASRKQSVLDLSESIGSSSNELTKMDGSGEAARAQDEVEQIRAKLHSDAEEYVRLKLASTILKNAVDRYRKRNEGPVLRRASELFQRLTLGAFTELVQDFDDAGKPVICGYRPADQSHVGVSGMSEGTCDQLYLALRLATLEVWLDQHDPIPFIVDDILIQFDDERASAALKIFAELSRRTQVIMFTHHQHLVNVAQETLAGTGILSVQMLDRSSMVCETTV